MAVGHLKVSSTKRPFQYAHKLLLDPLQIKPCRKPLTSIIVYRFPPPMVSRVPLIRALLKIDLIGSLALFRLILAPQN